MPNSPDAIINSLKGIPFLGPIDADLLTAGNIWWVSSVHATRADDPANGASPLRPFATWNYARTQSTANNDDVIILMPGHAETITVAAGIANSVAGVTVLGIAAGGNRPTISFTTATTATMTFTAANVTVKNVSFDLTGINALTGPVSVSAADVRFSGCRFILAGATNQAVTGILTTAAANRLVVEDCIFEGGSTAGNTSAIRLVGGDRAVIRNNLFYGAYGAGVGAIENITTDTTNTYIYGNEIRNLTAVSTAAMNFRAGSTGQVSRNYMQILSLTTPIVGTGLSWVGGNYYANAVATAGTLI